MKTTEGISCIAQFLGSAREAALYEAKYSQRRLLRAPRAAVSNINVHKAAAVIYRMAE